MTARLVTIRTFLNAFDADVAKSALDAADIDAVVQSDDASGLQPGLWTGRGVDLLVRREDATRAAEILDTPPEPIQDPPDSEQGP